MKTFSLVKILFLLVPIMFIGVSCQVPESSFSSDVIVFINSNSLEHKKGVEKLIPYLQHYGIKFTTIDLAKGKVLGSIDNYALSIISHPDIIAGNNNLKAKLGDYLEHIRSEGIGILSFDPQMPDYLLTSPMDGLSEDKNVGEIIFSDKEHYITLWHHPGEKKNLFGYMSVPKFQLKKGEILLTGNNHPLLVVSKEGKGKIAQWTSLDWMYNSILGPLGGLDDCLWKSIVWAARKPFVMQALPPIATMRVDDVVGCGSQQWNKTPFYWIKTVNKYGLKPWLGLFIYNLTPEGIEELKGIFNKGMATGSPHAFGRPPRPESSLKNFNAYYTHQMVEDHFIPDYWYPKAIPYLSDYYDEFIYFDHNNKKPWSDEIADNNLRAVDEWYDQCGLMPISNYLVAHWGAMGSNTINHVHDKWNIEFTSVKMVDSPWGNRPKFKNKPFGLYDEPIIGIPKDEATNSRAYYNADFIELANNRFFLFSSVIKDITGYEWQPDNNVEATAWKGIKTLSRGLEGKFLAVLFTHETDYIFKVEPENWEKIFSKICDGISIYDPVYLTTDEALKIVRAFHTSEIQTSEYNVTTGEVKVIMTGETDIQTSVYVYTEVDNAIIEKLIEIPPFKSEISKTFSLYN